ncbi:ComF family protein [Metabacillus fastidiosus]|uniref:ComF family protein n=2 Tax=Metabacillus fastidiosus TaxID=1458 RepID=UPI003D2BCF94
MTWRSFLLIEETRMKVCESCNSYLKKIEGEICPKCSRKNEGICYDCKRWEDDPEWKYILDRNVSIYEYNPFMKELLARYKFRGDAEIANVFKEELCLTYKREFQKEVDFIVPIPLSEERFYERGFNQSVLLAQFLKAPIITPLIRINHEKQSKKSRRERINHSNYFTINDTICIKEKNLLLIDDIYTTGSTLRHAAKVLKGKNAQNISSLTLIRS